jgi:hypothetical protein
LIARGKEMKKTSIIQLMMVCIIALLSMSTVAVQAITYCNVWTTDASNTYKEFFSPGEPVYAHWSGDGPVDIKVIAPDGVTIDAEWPNQDSSGCVVFTPNYEIYGLGYYEVCAYEAGTTNFPPGGCPGTPVGVGIGFTVPELPLGVMMAVVAGFAALATFKLKRK